MTRCCLLVDPYVSTEVLSETLHSYGIQLLALFTYHEKEKGDFSHLFDQVFHWNEKEKDAILNELKTKKIDFVQVGREYSVDIADEIATQICSQYANDPTTSFLRMNKYEMLEAVRKAGLRAPQQCKIHQDPPSDEDLRNLTKIPFPFVLKPSEASGSLGVKICNSLPEALNCMTMTMSEITVHGNKVHEVIIQELLKGEEYIVDSLSLQGCHVNTCVFRYGKTVHEQVPIYRYADVIDLETPEAIECCRYINKVLDAIGLKNGLSHAELFLTPTGPCLVEVNPRVSGGRGFANQAAREVYQFNQIDALAEMIQDKTSIQYLHSKKFKARCHSRIIFVQNFYPKILKAFNDNHLLNTLASYKSHLSFIKAGQKHEGVKALSDSCAYVLLVHDSQDQIMKDSEQIWHWEKEGMLC